MAITFSALLLTTIMVTVLCRWAGLRVLHALICILMGFFLASSQFAPQVTRIIHSIIRAFQ